MIRTSRRASVAIVVAGCLGWGALPARAQSPARTAKPESKAEAKADSTEASSMNCWWATDKRAVRVGETFGLTLTCRAMETDQVKVVPNLAELEPTSIELTPFEVLGGTRHADVVQAPWRYVQYQYTARLLGEEFFGRDIAIPATNVTFRIQTGGAETVEGTEHRYVLPAMPIRVLSLLPAQAADIQDPAVDTFADVEARRSRATMELVAAVIFFGFAAIPMIVAALRVKERFRTSDRAVEQALPARTVLTSCVREIERVRADALRDGWTSSLAGQALAPFRVAAAIALGQPVTQTLVTADVPAREGQVAVRHGRLRRGRALVSASITADAIDRLRGAGHGAARPGASAEVLDRIGEALTALSALRYGRVSQVDAQTFDRAVDAGCGAVRQLRKARSWPSRAVAALPRPAALPGMGAWSR